MSLPRRPSILLAGLPLALAACGQEPAPSPEPSDAASASAAPTSAPTYTAPNPLPTASDTSGIPEFGIPAALQGRWGMVPADCSSTRGDAKGLLVVSATTLTFYESVGKLGEIAARGDERIRAKFAFSGEGMTWTRSETLAASNDGKTLTRTETGGDEPGGPFTYTRCSS